MKKIAALLTGRGNNTLRDKNIMPVLGKPLLYYPAMATRTCKLVSDFFVSSDDEKILSAANVLGYKKIKRPAELALPTSQHVDTILHALKIMKEQYACEPDILVVMLANSATVKSEWITESIEQIINDDTISAVVPVEVDMDHHPFRAKQINEDGFLSTFFDFHGKKVSTNRQDLPKCCYLCHNFWTLNTKNFASQDTLASGQQPWSFMGNKIKPLIVEESFDIHNLEDIKRTENWLLREGISYDN